MEVEYPYWQKDYHAALVEFESAKLAVLIETAESAMFNRLQTLNGAADAKSERQAITDASRALLKIKEDLLGFPEAKHRAPNTFSSEPESD